MAAEPVLNAPASSESLRDSSGDDRSPAHQWAPAPAEAEGSDAPVRGLRLLLVATRQHLAGPDLRSLMRYLKSDDCNADLRLEVVDPVQHPELLELHRLVATPALVKLEPAPKQVFAGNTLTRQLRNWMPRWQQAEVAANLAVGFEDPLVDNSRTPREQLLEDQLLVLRQENETLIERLEEQEKLLRMVAHELRTPLTVAKLALQSHCLGQIDEIRFLDVLRRRFDDMESLSKELLEVGTTRWEALFNPQRLVLGQVAAEAILELEKLWVGREVELVTDMPGDLPDVFADPRRMRQVFLNLLENAFKYTPSGGRVSFRLWHRTSQWVEVIVCDSGPGIPDDEQERIFQDRVRLPQTSGSTSGYGVGLGVCRRIAEVQGGRIWVVSEPERGACFHVTVPVWNGQVRSPDPSR